MPVLRPRTLFVCLAVATAPGLALAGVSGTLDPEPGLGISPHVLAERRTARAGVSLDAFGLALGGGPLDLEGRGRLSREGLLRAGEDDYLHLSLAPAERELPAPAGLAVLDADLYFLEGERLIEATLLVSTSAGNARAIEALEALLGKPEFEAVLPGALDMTVGWRTAEGFVLASFSDLPIFRLSAFSNEPEDLVAGSSIVLFEGLSHYARRVEQGDPRTEVEEELRRVVSWVGMARQALRPER